jgi:hypothetical protein
MIAALAVASLAAHAQIVPTSPQSRSSLGKSDVVTYLFPEQVTVAAGKPSPVVLHFRVAPGLHINSHTPSEKYLIPTDFSIPEGQDVRLAAANYPAGTTISLPADPKTKLSVYTGEFTIQGRIVSAPGNHLVQARLHYQACNQDQCLPPKTLNVPIDVIGK